MEQQRRLYPIGIQTFQKIREGNYLYIDKTEYVYKMTHSASSYIFLSRPRRFGKSLLTSTLHAYFEGRKELFEGLAIDKMETEWSRYPVLHFDMSMAKHVDKERLEQMLSVQLYRYEETYGKADEEVTLNDRFPDLSVVFAIKQVVKLLSSLMNTTLLFSTLSMKNRICPYSVT